MQRAAIEVGTGQGRVDGGTKLGGQFGGLEASDDFVKRGCHGILGLVDALAHGRLILFGDLAHALHHIGESAVGTRDRSLKGLKFCACLNIGCVVPHARYDGC